ncbi:MAG: aminopeptidase [Theionarchaea archaeon]|nr:aminopeptidase [Theionarchaea archaeon]MBU7036542.1 aminopeptidase [Theionarchaea archaeon]
MDSRITEHAKILVDYSCEIQEGDHVVVVVEDYGQELAKEIVKLVAQRGGTTVVIQRPPEMERALLDAAPDEYVDRFPDHLFAMIEKTDAYIKIQSTGNTRALGNASSEKLVKYQLMQKPLKEEILKRKWCGTLFPTNALAQEAGMSLSEYEDFVYRATLRDWEKEAQIMYKVKEIIDKGKDVVIEGEDTELTMSIEGRVAVASVGKHNMPSGEVYTAPVDDSTNGHIYFDIPLVYLGSLIEDVRLMLKDGVIVESSASKNEELLKTLIETDGGSRRLGELGIGTNRGIDRFTQNILFDEKIGDTIHLALGNAYKECNGVNESAIHIDIVKSMKNGKILVDGDILQKNGKWCWEL